MKILSQGKYQRVAGKIKGNLPPQTDVKGFCKVHGVTGRVHKNVCNLTNTVTWRVMSC